MNFDGLVWAPTNNFVTMNFHPTIIAVFRCAATPRPTALFISGLPILLSFELNFLETACFDILSQLFSIPLGPCVGLVWSGNILSPSVILHFPAQPSFTRDYDREGHMSGCPLSPSAVCPVCSSPAAHLLLCMSSCWSCLMSGAMRMNFYWDINIAWINSLIDNMTIDSMQH